MRATVGELDAIAKEPRAAHFSDCEGPHDPVKREGVEPWPPGTCAVSFLLNSGLNSGTKHSTLATSWDPFLLLWGFALSC